jgi:hypothetical protein
MTQQEKNILNQYASAKIAEKEAKKISSEIREKVDAILLANTTGEKGDKVIVETGKFSINFNRKYSYPPEVLMKEEKLKKQIEELKADSERLGTGEYEEKLSVTFKESNGHETKENN